MSKNTVTIDIHEFPNDSVYLPRFYEEVSGAGLPVICVDCSLSNPPNFEGNVYANFERELTPTEQLELDTIVATHDSTPPDVILDVSGTIGGQPVTAAGVLYTDAF